MHIIKPSLIKLNTIIEAVKQHKFHYSWLLVWYSKAFLHESKVVVKWAVSSFLESDLYILIQQVSVENLENTLDKFNDFILGSLLLTLQKFFLYQKAEDMCLIESCPKTAVLLSNFFNGFLNSLPTQILRIEFLEKFTEFINKFSWNATCLLFISRVFYCIDSSLTNNLSPNIIKNFHKIIKCSISTQEIFIRSATQTFITKALIKHINPKELTAKFVKDFFDFIGMLSTKECLAYKTTTWNSIVDWLEQAINSESKDLVQPLLFQEFNTFLEDSNTNEFTHTNESVKIAKLILLFCDTNSEKAYKITLESLTDRLINCNKYVYSSSEKVEKCLMIFSSLIDYLKSNLCLVYQFNL